MMKSKNSGKNLTKQDNVELNDYIIKYYVNGKECKLSYGGTNE